MGLLNPGAQPLTLLALVLLAVPSVLTRQKLLVLLELGDKANP
jgi:heme exporter protein D